MLTRRRLLATGAAAFAAPALANAAVSHDIDWLEARGEPGALHDSQPFVAPGAVHEAYTHAIYVNTSFHGDARQKMWVLSRKPGPAGGGWHLALTDESYWADRGSAGYSWPVSTGALHPGNNRAGPTPSGIFNIDERMGRYRDGWGSPGMYKAIYIDLHYSSGRISGVAMHGTTAGRYPVLGRPDSLGCVRVTQVNMDRLHATFHPGGAKGAESPLWGEVPRFFTSEPEDSLAARRGYVRDGTLLTDGSGNVLTKMGYTALMVYFRDDL